MEMHKIVAIIANSALYLLFLSLISPFRFVLMLFSPSHKSTFKKVEEWGCVISRVAKKKKKEIVKEYSTLSLLCKPTEIWLAWAIQPPVRRALSKHWHLFYAQCPTKHTHKALSNKCTRGKKDVSKYIWALMVMIMVAIANPNNWCLIRNVDSIFLCMDLCRIEQQSRESGVEICHSFVSPLPGEKHLHTYLTHAFMSFFIYHYLLREERCQNILGF